MSESKFLLDGMLGSLAKWLRIAGFDTLYYRDLDDDRLIELTREMNRVLLTRDQALVKRTRKKLLNVVYVESHSVGEQLFQLRKELGLRMSPRMSRCPLCNGCLSCAVKSEVVDRVPPLSLEAFNEFWVCEDCGKVYWKGSHWDNIVETLDWG